jgi:hypothetical protein
MVAPFRVRPCPGSGRGPVEGFQFPATVGAKERPERIRAVVASNVSLGKKEFCAVALQKCISLFCPATICAAVSIVGIGRNAGDGNEK